MFVTTVEKTNEWLNKRAFKIAEQFGIPYYERKKKTIKQMQSLYKEPCIVVGKVKTELYDIGNQDPLFFHPNMAAVRIKRIAIGEVDPFVRATGLFSGMSILDCTLGMGADALIASYVTGDSGKVTALEVNPYIHFVIKDGLERYPFKNIQMQEAAKRIETVNTDYLTFLKSRKNDSYDVVYMDPMFTEGVTESTGIQSLGSFASYMDLTKEAIDEARRVAKKRVILKDYFKSERFAKFGFEVEKRKTAKFHYGVIELE